MGLPERKPPTHILTVEVPLHLDVDGPLDFAPVRDAIQMVLPISRAAYAGAICDALEVSLREVEQA